jgi:lysyl-tRNA synthetase class 2
VERHPLGPRVFFAGVRWHDWHLGLAILLALAIGALAGLVHDSYTSLIAALAGVWLIAKDWRDVTARRRDTAAWRLGLHRVPAPLRTFRRWDPLPTLVALAATAIALVDLMSAITPDVAWRGHLLLQLEPVQDLRVFHALAVPTAIALLVSAYYLQRRRRRALWLATGVLAALAVLNLVKGLDFEEAIADVVVATALVLGRSSFYVRHDPLTRREAWLRAPLAALAGFCVSLAVVALAAPRAGLGTVLTETSDLLLWQDGPITFRDELSRLDLAVGVIGVATLLVAAYLVFRPLAAPRDLPDARTRGLAAELVRTHGTDTLAYFKLRRDKHYLFSEDRRAFLGYRVANGVLIVSGEPVGPPDAIAPLLAGLGAFAEERGLRIAALGVGEALQEPFRALGLRSFYVGDEALVDTATFSLEGRAMRKVRQSVTRLAKAGYRAELVALGEADAETTAALERVSAAWRGRRAERGFSMAMDALRADEQQDTLLLVARDGAGEVRGFLHLVPTFGRRAASLSAMRRDADTPNGLTEFMVVRAIEALAGRGVEELSLNFAAFARVLTNPSGRVQRTLRRILHTADAYFQIERLYRFNAKFEPRWEPRYLMYEGPRHFLRTALATLSVEGQLPTLGRRKTAR